MSAVPNSRFLFYKKYNEGLVVTVPSGSSDKVQFDELSTLAFKTFFGVEADKLVWKPIEDHRTISKFEVGGDQGMALVKQVLIIKHAYHFRLKERDFFLTDFFRWDNGHEQELFDRGLGAESMQGCNDMVELVYSITGEKIEGTNSPCEIIALPN